MHWATSIRDWYAFEKRWERDDGEFQRAGRSYCHWRTETEKTGGSSGKEQEEKETDLFFTTETKKDPKREPKKKKKLRNKSFATHAERR